MKNLIKSEEIEKIKKQLPGAGAYVTISALINGVYKPRTIAEMFKQNRTMNPGVLEAAQKLIDLLKNSNNTIDPSEGYNRRVNSAEIIYND